MLRKTRQKLTYNFLKNQHLDDLITSALLQILELLEVCKK